MSKFNHADYQANPGKYRLFKTATIAGNIVTHNGEHDLPEGQIVGVKYRFDAFNAMYRRTEPVYTVTGPFGSLASRDLYANALADFVL